MTHPLIDRLIDECGYPEVTLASHDEFVARPGMNVLFFPGDPTTVRDATDVAVILPELVREFAGALQPGVVTDVFGDGKQLRRHYRFSVYPALVFVRDGNYVGTITRVKDWAIYLQLIADFFALPARRRPQAEDAADTPAAAH